MIEIRNLERIMLPDLLRIAGGYTSYAKYVVKYRDSKTGSSFSLRRLRLARPFVKVFDYDEEKIKEYNRMLKSGYSFGAFEGGDLVGLILAEPRSWNMSVWVQEFHVLESYRKGGLGKKLMGKILEKASNDGFRIIVCETQNTNVNGIDAYRGLGFRLESVDISYYTNEDFPDGEIAVFMKRRL